MLFSVLTITYNAGRYLAEALESVACQEGVSFEHLLWDGGSKDNTLAIARSFPHVAIFEGKDGGIADAMNQIAAKANGQYLIFLHADDRLAHSDVLKYWARVLSLHPEFLWFYGQAHFMDGKGNIYRTTPYEPFSYKRLKKYNFISHPSALVAKELFQKVGGFDSSLRYCMDYDLWLRLAAQCRPLALSTPLAAFREHEGSLSTSLPLEVAKEAYAVRNRYLISLWERYRSYRTWKKRKKSVLGIK